MSIIQPQRAGTQELSGFYDKVSTNADASRFLGSEAGKREIIRLDSATNVVDEGSGNYLVTLDTFSYLVGINQLQVSLRKVTGGINHWLRILDRDTTIQDPSFLAVPSYLHYEEVSSTQVRIVTYSTSLSENLFSFLFEIPHTSVPAELREKVVVQDQGDNIAFEGLGNGDGILLRSVGGRKVLAQVDDSRNWVMRYL